MKSEKLRSFPTVLSVLRGLACMWVSLRCVSAMAYPPAPPHIIYGMVRDEMGNPLVVDDALVILETGSGNSVVAMISPGLEPGINYRMSIPLDSGASLDMYRRNAMTKLTPFSMRVQIGSNSYLPIEMSGTFPQLGEPATSQRIDLTLGEDSDGDGLPDAWERALLASAQGVLKDIDPNADADSDGLSNLEEYHAGTFAFDAKDGFSLKMVEFSDVNVSLEFMAIRGRTYRVFGSSNLDEWTEVTFSVAGGDEDDGALTDYSADMSEVVQIKVDTAEQPVSMRFFKLRVE